MPTYQYRCAKCAEQFELWQSIHDDGLERHPGCGGKVTKVLSPAGIVLKGPGFYRTDSRISAAKSRDKSEKSEKVEAKQSEKSESNGSGNGSGSKSDSKSSSSSSTESSEKTSAKPSKKDASST